MTCGIFYDMSALNQSLVDSQQSKYIKILGGRMVTSGAFHRQLLVIAVTDGG